MSYDITFIHKSEGQTWREAVDANEARAVSREPWNMPAAEETRSEWKRIADLLLGAHPGMERFEAPHTLELTDTATGLQVSLFEGEAAIAIPYGLPADVAGEVMKVARQLARIIEAETGLQGYDPQRGGRFLETIESETGRRAWWQFWKRA